MKASYATLAEIPEAQRTEYVESGGRYVLKVEGDLPGFIPAAVHNDVKASVVSFRDTNTKLLSALGVAGLDQIDVALARAQAVAGMDPERLKLLKDIDPAEYAALREKVAKLKNKGVDSDEDLSKQISAAVTAAMAPVQAQLATETAARKVAQAAADKGMIRAVIAERYQKAGGKAGATDFIVSEFEKAFEVAEVGGQRVVKAKADRFSSENPGQPMKEDEWLAGAVKAYDFAFEASGGGGARPAAGGAPGKPGARILKDPTPEDLGRPETAAAIRKGELVIQYSEP